MHGVKSEWIGTRLKTQKHPQLKSSLRCVSYFEAPFALLPIASNTLLRNGYKRRLAYHLPVCF